MGKINNYQMSKQALMVGLQVVPRTVLKVRGREIRTIHRGVVVKLAQEGQGVDDLRRAVAGDDTQLIASADDVLDSRGSQHRGGKLDGLDVVHGNVNQRHHLEKLVAVKLGAEKVAAKRRFLFLVTHGKPLFLEQIGFWLATRIVNIAYASSEVVHIQVDPCVGSERRHAKAKALEGESRWCMTSFDLDFTESMTSSNERISLAVWAPAVTRAYLWSWGGEISCKSSRKKKN